MSWQPIETAPTDGRHILGYGITPTHDQDRGVVTNEKHISVIYALWGGFVEFPFRNSIVQGQTFTHWMPLPNPPEPA